LPSHKQQFKSKKEYQEKDRKFHDYINRAIGQSMRHIDLNRWLKARIIEDKTELNENRTPEELKMSPRQLPDVTSLLYKRTEL